MTPRAAAAEAEFILDVLKLDGTRVLDLACGYGRHAHKLAARAQVVGLDINRDYLAQAQPGARGRAAKQLKLVQGDMRRLPFAAERFDAVLLLFNSFGYFAPAETAGAGAAPKQQVWKLPSVFYERGLVPQDFGRFEHGAKPRGTDSPSHTHDDNESVLEEVSRVLKPGGSLLIELPNPKPLLRAIATHPRRHIVTADYEIEEEYEWNAGTRILHNRSRFRVKSRSEEGAYAIRLYEPPELRTLLRKHGLMPVKSYGSYHGDPFTSSSSDILLVHARKGRAA